MVRFGVRARMLVILLVVCVFPSMTQTGGTTFVNFESAFTNPVRLSGDGTRLYAVNNPNASLSIFNVQSNPALPTLEEEIPVGIEPVSVNENPLNTDEVWVVNQESDSVSVVSRSKGIVVATLNAKDEPADVVFAGQYAFISAARNNTIYVYNATTLALVTTIPVFGGAPRAMAVSPKGTQVYVAMALSGDQTTAIPFSDAPPPPPPTNPALPPAPQQDIIVTFNDPAWSSYINYTLPDNDVAIINATSPTSAVTYFNTVGTINQGIAVQPSTGDVFVTNMASQNLVRFQPALCGLFVQNRISKITPSGTVTAYVLDPTPTGNNYCAIDTAALSVALAEPTGIVFDGTGQNVWIAAFGTDRVAKVTVNGSISEIIDTNPAETGSTVNAALKKGPRGLAIDNTTNMLYVLNRITNDLTVVNTSTNQVVANSIPAGSRNPTPPTVTAGRGFLYDAKLSGVGIVSCASCHIDGEADHLAWDLGNPDGTMTEVPIDGGTSTAEEHPMKGPMVTQVLRGLLNAEPYHWRGDKPEFSDFNEAFQQLLGGNQLTTPQMTAFTNFVNTIVYMPNPYENLNRTYPTVLTAAGFSGPGNAVTGAQEFQTVPVAESATCETCHPIANGLGTNLQIQIPVGEPQPLKVPHLRIAYQKQLFTRGGPSIDGFGITSEGDHANLIEFFQLTSTFPLLAGKIQDQLNIAAYNLSFDTGMAPVVGYAITLTSANVSNGTVTTNWSTLESQASGSNNDLIAEGSVGGQLVNLQYQPSLGEYTSTTSGVGPYTHANLITLVKDGATLTVMGVPFGSGGNFVAPNRTIAGRNP
jgi:DNA-binding beta-propeller fold protein YncE